MIDYHKPKTSRFELPELTIFLFCFLFISISIQPTKAFSQLATKQNTPANHHTEDGFSNPYLNQPQPSIFKYFKMRLLNRNEYADYEANFHKVPTMPVDLDRLYNPAKDLQITWIGHATTLIQYQGINILTDPVFSDRASPTSFSGPRRFTSPALTIEELPKIDYVVISHNHYDHLDRDSVQSLGSEPVWLVPMKLKSWFIEAGIDAERVMEFDWWDNMDFGLTTITATPSQHWSSRTLWDRKKSLWASWLIEIGDKTIWYSGDTGYNQFQFKEIGRKFPEIDLALIAIGAYEPRWFMKYMHINPTEAGQIHTDIKSRYSLGIHWGTFQLTAEPIDDPPIKLKEALIKQEIPLSKFETLKIGETREIKNHARNLD